MNKTNNQLDPIESNEKLYRRVKNKGSSIEYGYDEYGNLEFYEDAFHDNGKEISLHRAKYIKLEKSRKNNIEGVLCLIAKEIESIEYIKSCINKEIAIHNVKLVYTPGREKSHSSIILDSNVDKLVSPKAHVKTAFHKLKIKLAKKCKGKQWELKPEIQEVN